jgi:hydrogenase expression/formation protein HypC
MPARIVEREDGDQAIADFGGVKRPVSLALLEGIEVGDWVIVHVGYALSRLDPDEAERTLDLLREAVAAGRGEP